MTDVENKIEVTAFGQTLLLQAGADTSDVPRRVEELANLYEPALASRSIPRSGQALDIGAGAGWFALPFASAFPDWSVTAFEVDPAQFRCLSNNVQMLGLSNVRCVNAAFHPNAEAGADTGDWLEPASSANFEPLIGLEPRVIPANRSGGTRASLQLPALRPATLRRLAPDLAKLEAPFVEREIALALQDVDVHLILGRLYEALPSDTFNPVQDKGRREYYLMHHDHVLRRDFEHNTHKTRIGLDVVIAMYNARAFITECIDSLLADSNPEVHLIVVDDGSTDGCGAMVADRYAAEDRVRLVTKANGGCASARNHGRQHSNASHIAFVDADDRVDPDMFSALFEIARYTGAYVTEGEFAFLSVDDDGTEALKPSYETTLYPDPGTHSIGSHSYLWINGRDLCIGQPTIWRRVHRRDFLDQKNIWFPEHVRAFDDQIFQFLVGHYCDKIAHVRDVRYHYRQHPEQDIKQGDERHFYSFNMFRAVLIRSLQEGWRDNEHVFRALLNTMRWSYGGLRSDLKATYRAAAVQFLAMITLCYGRRFSVSELDATLIDGLQFLLEQHLKARNGSDPNYGYSRLEDWRWQPEFILMAEKIESSQSPSAV